MIVMRKALFALIGIALIAAVAWTGLWFYGKGRIVEEIEAQARIIRAQGGEAEYETIELGGFPLGYTGRIIAPRVKTVRDVKAPSGEGTVPATIAWSAPWIEASATVMAPNAVGFTFPETQVVILDLPELEGASLPITLTSQDLKMTTARDGDDITFDGDASTLGGSFSRLSQESGQIDMTWTIRDMDLSGKTGQAQATDRKLALNFKIASLDGSAIIGGNETTPGGKIDFRSDAAAIETDSLGAETTINARLNAFVATLSFDSLGGQPFDIGVDSLEAMTRMPNDAAAEPQPFAYRIAVKDVTAADLIWTMLDPEDAFTREINALSIDMEGDAIFTAAPSNSEAFARAMESGLPVDVSALRLKDLTVDALGLRAKGKGEGTLESTIPQGTATLAVDGIPDFMNSMVKSGRIPPQQAMVVQLMIESFGKLDEEGDTVHFDFEARDGMMYVNGVPIGEAPAMPQ